MSKNIRQLKQCARSALKGNYTVAIAAFLIMQAVSFFVTSLTDIFFSGDSVFDLILSQIFLFILLLITGIVSAGYSYLYLNMARGKQYSLADLIYFFKNNPDRVIIGGFTLAVMKVALNIFYYCYVSYTTTGTGETLAQQIAWAEAAVPCIIASIFAFTLCSIPLSMIYFLLADDPELGGFEAFDKSVEMMKGNMRKYFLMELSFLPILLLSVFSLYLSLLWIFPYIEMTMVMFYRDLNGEFSHQEYPQIPKEPGL